MGGGLGVYGARTCTEIVDEFMKCRKSKGITGMLQGGCTVLYDQMNACLDKESAERRKANLVDASERMKRYQEILDSQK